MPISFFIIVMTAPFLFVIFMALIKSNENKRRNQLKAEIYMKALEKGERLPEDLFERPVSKNKSLKTAIMLISVGIGIMLYMFTPSEPLWNISAGFIPLFLGIGFLIIHFIWKRQGIEDEE